MLYRIVDRKDLQMYDKLKQLIENHNEQYQKFNDLVHSTKNDNDLKIATQQRWQFIHDYANFLHGFLWDHMQELTPDDLSLLDLVPYIVWNKMTEKSHIVVETIQKIHNGRWLFYENLIK